MLAKQLTNLQLCCDVRMDGRTEWNVTQNLFGRNVLCTPCD